MELGINIAQEEKKAGQKARRKLRREIHKRMYDMVSVGKGSSEKGLDTTTVKVLMEPGQLGLDALRIDIPRHGLIHAHGWRPKNGGPEYRYPYLLDAMYETDIIKDLADDLAQIRGEHISDMMVKGFPRKQ